jgi:hypothetical protein
MLAGVTVLSLLERASPRRLIQLQYFIIPYRISDRDVWNAECYLHCSLGPPVAVECQETPLAPAVRYAASTSHCEIAYITIAIRVSTASISSA